MPEDYAKRLESAAQAEEARGALKEQISSLSRLTKQLRASGALLVMSTMALLFAVVLVVLLGGAGTLRYNLWLLLQIFWCWGISNIGLAIYHGLLSKQGGVVFDEISEELHWHVHSNRVSGAPKELDGGVRPAIEVRVALRSYLQYTDLLLVPGKFGPAIYALLNMMVPVGAWILFR